MEKNMIDIKEIIKNLAIKRRVFHSEKDFQFELAQIIHDSFPSHEIRLERPFLGDSQSKQPIYPDIFVFRKKRLHTKFSIYFSF